MLDHLDSKDMKLEAAADMENFGSSPKGVQLMEGGIGMLDMGTWILEYMSEEYHTRLVLEL